MWTAKEEQIFRALMAFGLDRLAAIRLFRRMRGDLMKAMRVAQESQARREIARVKFKGSLQGQNRPLANERPKDAPSPRSHPDVFKRGAR